MDKSKNRTDLLAAGRKKLQQFRQTKDGKGSGSSSHGKSSKKHVKGKKHDDKADSVSSGDRSSESSHLIVDEMGQQHADYSASHVDSSVSSSANAMTPEIDDDKADELSLLLIQETNAQTLDETSQLDLPVNGADLESHNVLTTAEVFLSEEGTDADSVHPAFDHRNIPLIGARGDHMVDGSLSEVALKYEATEESPRFLDVDPAIPDIQTNANETLSRGEEGTSCRETSTNLPSEAESLSSNSLLSLSTPVQVIAVKAASHCEDLNVKDSHHIDDEFIQVKEDKLADEVSTHEFEHETNLPPIPSGILNDEDSALNGTVSTTEHEVEASNLEHSHASEMSTSKQGTSHSISMLLASEEQNEVTTVIPSLEYEAKVELSQHKFPDWSLIHAREDQEADFSDPENVASSIKIEVDEDGKQNEVLSCGGSIPGFGASNEGIPATTPEDIDEMRRDVITFQPDISDTKRIVGGSQGEAIRQFDENDSLRLVQLSKSLKQLNEDDFRILMKMRDVQVVSGDTERCCEPNHVSSDVLDVYKEHIYVANVLKDIYGVQLVEQSKPLFNANHMIQQYDDKLSNLAVSLEDSKERNRTLDEELMLCRSELKTTSKNVEEFSSAVHEWKEKYFRSEEDLSIVTKDLYECRSLVENLQRENRNLNGRVKSMLDDRNQHVEDKENLFKENEKLEYEVSELKSQLAGVQLQNDKLTDNMNLAAEHMKKLGDEKESLVQNNKILSSELADCKNILADVQAKHSNANESIIILTEEKTRLQSQQHDAFLAFEKFMLEMAESKNRLAYLEAENKKLSVHLSSEAEEKKKIKEENQCLLHDYEVLSSENRAIQEALLSERVEKLDLESYRNKVNLWLEQLIEESIFLHICLEMLKSNDKECESSNENQHSVNERDERSIEECGGQMQEELQRLITLNMQLEMEIKGLRLSLNEAEEQLIGVQTELQRKIAEAEQSEQRVSSIREKLSIAVAKGKGLIVQRDNLKQSLAETSSELEKSRQQLQLCDSRLLEAETKLKTYAEAGERVEALESELSYIRNSATALRESFLLKDSVLQRIEEILEQLELPEHLHSGEVIDKVDWLARSVVGISNALPMTAYEQKTKPEGGSYADNAFVEMGAWEGDTKHSSRLSDDLRIKHEELQNKFYGLAEQNEMLEQSLMEGNSAVQRLEEALDKINMPAHLRSLEAASQIEWLGGALSDALQQASNLQESLDNHETHSEKLLAELEESQRSFYDIKSVLESTVKDKEQLLSTVTELTRDIDGVQERAAILELENRKMQNEIDNLQVKLVKNDDDNSEIECGIKRMIDLIFTALPDHSLAETASFGSNLLQLEEILRRLIDEYTRLSVAINVPMEINAGSVEKAVSTHDDSGEVASSAHDASYLKTLEKKLEEASGDLTHVEEERDMYKEKYKSLCDEMEAVQKQNEELQSLLNQEEQKSASLREKLNVAVRKGKSLVQQRDSLKQTIEEMNMNVASLTSEIINYRSTITQYEEKFMELSSYAEKVWASESENQMLRSQLTQTEHYLQEEVRTLSSMLDVLNGIQLNGGFNSSDPIEKLHQLGKACQDLFEAKAFSDQESVKSKRAAELLLAELNEVQERNDALQDELAKVINELSELSKANQILEVARDEALSQLAEFSAAQKDDQKKRDLRIAELKTSVDHFLKLFKDVIHLVADVFLMDMDFFKSLDSFLDEKGGVYVNGARLGTEDDDKQKEFNGNGIPAWEKFIASDSWLMHQTQEQLNGSVMDDIFGYVEYLVCSCTSSISSVKDRLESYITLKALEATRVSTILRSFQGELNSQIKSFEKEREAEKNVLLKNIALLYEACADSIQQLGNKKAHMSTNNPSLMDMRMSVRSAEIGEDFFFSEEQIRALSERLMAAVRVMSSSEQEILEAGYSEMKSTIANLQNEMHEKDIQKERICMELVGQIKQAEGSATKYSHDLEVATSQIYDLKTQVSAIEKDKNILEQKMKEMEDEKSASVELRDKVRSMTDMLSAKDQEIESLMQALDEEDSELEEMSKKLEQIEMELQKKNKEMGKLEHSHSKAMKKLSVTVSKFDELHDLSAGLLTEVEKLQMQVQERDKEISFLRQEVTRCTNDILQASQSKKNSDDIIEFYEWLKTATSKVDLMDASPNDLKLNDVNVHKESIQNQIASILSELEDLRLVAGSRDEMLQVEKNRVQELLKKQESLETALRQKESQLNLLEEAPTSSGIGGIQQLENKWVASGPSTSSQVRSLRKSNNDQVAIAIDDDPATSSRLEDEDEDKVHGFKSLTTSRIVPRFTRPVSDMIDGLWVSCDRALMQQPALRLSIILYWALLHALVAAFVV